MNKDQVDYDREIDEWRYQVGHALLSFVDIEFFTLRCLDLIPSDKISKASFRRPFTERMDLLIEIIKDRCNTPSSAAAHLIDKLKVAKKLAETRNLIAHSPLQLKVPTWATAADRVISDARSPDRLIDLASSEGVRCGDRRSCIRTLSCVGSGHRTDQWLGNTHPSCELKTVTAKSDCQVDGPGLHCQHTHAPPADCQKCHPEHLGQRNPGSGGGGVGGLVTPGV